MNPTVYLLLVLVAVVICAARLTRLVTQDVYPPVQWLRDRWDAAVGDSLWQPLMHCPYCAAPYLSALIWAPVFALNPWPFGWGMALVFWGAISYLAAIVVIRDGE